MTALRDLARFQHWMQAVITSGEAGLEPAVRAGAAACGVTLEQLDEFVLPGPRLSGAERLSIYARMIRLRFLESMEDDFRGVRALVGPERFTALATRYLAERPSRSFTLSRLGAAFPDWLGELAHELEHPELARELAAVERAILEVHAGPDGAALELDDLLALPRERWIDVRFGLAPSLRLFACRYPVNAYLSDVLAGANSAPPQPRATWICVHRTDWHVQRTELSHGEHALLTALRGGATLGDAFGEVLSCEELDAEQLLASVGDTFRDWSAKQILSTAVLAAR